MRKSAAFPQIPGVELVEELGRGAHAIVYRASKRSRQLVVKLQRAADPAEAVRFRREAALLACLRHPALPAILDVGELDGRPWLVMDFAEGRTLAQLLAGGPLSQPQIVRIACDLAGALAEVHGRGLVHRDVKPDNVLVGPDGATRLLDFGLVARVGVDASDEVAGTFLYAAPEQTRMLARAVDGRSDLYALGVLLFECAAGHPPFAAGETAELLRAHAVRPAPDLSRIRPGLSRTLARIVAKLLAKDPDDRYQSGRGLLADLQRIDLLDAHGDDAVLGARDAPQPLFETGVVGYARELAILRERWRAARAGHGSALLLEGPAGHGKSRLLRELAGAVRDADEGLVLQARCGGGDRAPFDALREAFEAWLRRVRAMPGGPRAEVERRIATAAGPRAAAIAGAVPALAALLSPGAAEPPGETVHEALAAFLAALARAWGGLLFVVDDAEWLDDASREVLHRLVPSLARVPLLVAAAGCAAEPGLAPLVATLGEGLAERLPLHGLDEAAGRALLAQHLGGGQVPEELARAVATRAQGAPFAIVESLLAMLDAGLLAPAWGAWRVDTAGLEKLALPADVIALLARRVEGVSPAARPVLQAAAVHGSGATAGLLERVTGAPLAAVQVALEEALRLHLLERGEHGRLAFVHERVRAALLLPLGDAEIARLHRAFAERIAAAGERGPETAYALARHLARGGGDPLPIHDANLRAGQLALQAGANEEARAFLAAAQAAAQRAALAPGPALEEALGLAAARAGRYGEAAPHLERAASTAPRRLDRARAHAALAEVHLAQFATAQAWREIEAGFRALRRPYPTGTPGSWLLTLLLALAGTVLRVLGLGAGTHGARREKHELLARLANLGSRSGHLDGRPCLLVQMTLVPLYSVHRLGRSRELAAAYAAQAAMLARFGERRLAGFLARSARALAAALRDRPLAARAAVFEAVGSHARGDDAAAEALHRANLEENAAWIDPGDARIAADDLAGNLLLRGHAREAWAAVEQALVRADGHAGPLPCTAAVALAMLGRTEEATAWLARAAGDEPWREERRREGRLALLLEEGERGARLDEALAGLRTPRRPLLAALVAHARLAQLDRGGEAAAAAAAEDALATLRRVARGDAARGHVRLIEAAIAAHRGDRARALRLLGGAEALASAADAPWVRFDAMVQRAALVGGEQGRREAHLARALAGQHGWSGRARRLARRWRLGEADAAGEAGNRSERGSAAQLKVERQLAALLQVSRACASVLHPDRVADVALDEIVRIFAAERALLFLAGPDGALVEKAARATADGISLCDYSSTVVQRVWSTRQALLVSSVEEEASLGAHSVVVHELRSILAVPLVVRDEAIGVVYVDNRLARGVFGPDDVRILQALATQIGTALETARAVQLELERKALEHDLAQAYAQATTDALTGLRNRRFLDERIDAELARARRSGRPFSLLLLDVDKFKNVNDTHGHLVGDRVLEEVGDVLAQMVRASDLAARYGGEEFCVLLPDTSVDGARILAERVRESLAARQLPLDSGALRVTASLGVATWGVHGTEREQLIVAADEALYEAKEAGRNQVRVARARKV